MADSKAASAATLILIITFILAFIAGFLCHRRLVPKLQPTACNPVQRAVPTLRPIQIYTESA